MTLPPHARRAEAGGRESHLILQSVSWARGLHSWTPPPTAYTTQRTEICDCMSPAASATELFCPLYTSTDPLHPVSSTIDRFFCPLYTSTHYTQSPQPWSFSVRSIPEPTSPSLLNHRSFLSVLYLNPQHPAASTIQLFCPLYTSTHYTQLSQPQSFSVRSLPQPTIHSCLNHSFSVRSMPQPTIPSRLNRRPVFLPALYLNPLHPVASTIEFFFSALCLNPLHPVA